MPTFLKNLLKYETPLEASTNFRLENYLIAIFKGH